MFWPPYDPQFKCHILSWWLLCIDTHWHMPVPFAFRWRAWNRGLLGFRVSVIGVVCWKALALAERNTFEVLSQKPCEGPFLRISTHFPSTATLGKSLSIWTHFVTASPSRAFHSWEMSCHTPPLFFLSFFLSLQSYHICVLCWFTDVGLHCSFLPCIFCNS